MILLLAIVGFVLAAIPAIMFLRNLPLFCLSLSDQPDEETNRAVSVLIPARDEASGIGECIAAALANQNVNLEVIVLDDHSTDATPEIVQELAEQDSRVRYILGKDLPDEWNGKQFACMQLADLAQHDQLVFLDADVRLRSDSLAKLIARQNQTRVALLSAFPHQETETWLERWLIPMVHYILLGYLPIGMMRRTTNPAFAAGCGQLFVTTREAYMGVGGHGAIKATRHDGIMLPRIFRKAGFATDVIDGTDLADCRMYTGAKAVIRGVLKNAVEGIANPRLIVLFTVLLLGASVLPLATLVASIFTQQTAALVISVAAVVVSHLPRAIAAARFRQSWFGAACHVLATPLFVLLQWTALWNHLTGRTISWRGRQ